MVFEVGRVNRILGDLEKMMYPYKEPIRVFKIKDALYCIGSSIPEVKMDWDEYLTGDLWGGYDKHRWFSCNIIIPEKYHNKAVVFKITTGHEGEWDALNPQFLFYLNGEIIQGLDVNHREVLIAEKAEAGKTYSILMLGYSGLRDIRTSLNTELCVIDREIEALYYNIKVPLSVAELLGEANNNRVSILNNLEIVMNILDLRKSYSEDFYSSVRAANIYLKEKFYTDIDTAAPLVTAIGHTHLDIAWLWTIGQTKEKTVRSFATVLRLMKEYPEYKFMSSQPQLYEYIKEYQPEMYEEIKQRVKEKRWEIDGAMWLEADCNIPSGESLVRQILFGMKFFKEEFDVECKALWLPDVFGYSAALPQILKKSGIKYFMTTKIDWNQFNRIPNDTFMWRGIDGTEIFTHFITTCDYDKVTGDNVTFTGKNNKTTYTGDINANQVMGTWNRYQNKDINDETLMAFGFGDGGGGPTKEMLENAKRLKYGIPGCPRIEIGFEGGFFDRSHKKLANNKKLSKWVGELYLEYHRGTYTSMAKNKKYNRKSEFMYQDAEMLATLGMLLDENYPKEEINKGWKGILLNQFHDIIPGSSIKQVYDESHAQYEEILHKGNKLINDSIKKITSKIDLLNKSIVLFNTLSYDRDDLVEIELPWNLYINSIKDSDGSIISTQLVEDGKKIIFFAKNIPSKGYKSYEIIEEVSSKEEDKTILNNSFNNKYYKVCFDENYNITSLFDKVNNWEVFKNNERGNVIQAFEDRPMQYENWDIDIYYAQKMWEVNNVKEAILIENGPIRYCIKITREFLDSTIVQYMYFYNDIPRIDFKTCIDWKEQNILLKVAFPTNVNATKATYEIQYGNIERDTHNNTSWDVARFEVCGHKWADLSDGSHGLSLLNDCKYGYDIKNEVMRLTLLKCGTYPNPEADLGYHEFTYSIYPHKDSWKEANTQQMAYNLNVPLYSIIEEAHEGYLNTEMSMLKINKNNCIVEVVKKAEETEGVIIRLFEYMNKCEEVNISFAKEIDKVWECDLLENKVKEEEFNKDAFNFIIKPYEIKTYLINFKAAERK